MNLQALEKTYTTKLKHYPPEFMRLKASSGYPVIDEKDVRNEVLAYIFDKGNPSPQRILSFDISVSDTGKRSGFVFFPKGQ